MEPSKKLLGFAEHFRSQEEQDRIANLQNVESRRLFIMVLGMTGGGKSTTIQHLLRKCKPIPVATPFGEPPGQSVTTEPKMHEGYLYDCPATFIDQAGFGDSTGLTNASILGNTLVFCATQVPRQRIDGFIIVQAAQDSRSYIEQNCQVVEALFGKEALNRTLVLVTKNEGLFGKKSEIIFAEKKFRAYEKEAKDIGGATVWHFFNSIVSEDYFEDIAQLSGLEKDQHEFYLPQLRRNVQYFFQAKANPNDNRVLQIKKLYDDITYLVRKEKGSVKEIKIIQAQPATKVEPKQFSLFEAIILSPLVVLPFFVLLNKPQETEWNAVKTHFELEYNNPGVCFSVEVNYTGDYANCTEVRSLGNRKVSGSLDCIGQNTPTITIAFTISPPEKDSEVFKLVKEAIAKHSYQNSELDVNRCYPTSFESLKALVCKEINVSEQ